MLAARGAMPAGAPGGRQGGIMTASVPAAGGRIFISYRREETAYPAGWLFDRLIAHFGQGQVFKDVDSIRLGDDFVEVISAAVASCDVLLALIGDRWLTITGEDGRRRLDDPDDFVRLEVEAALTRDVRVIPVLIDGARMPEAAELPPSLASLVRRQALELSPSRFDSDIGRLLRALDKGLAEAQAQGTPPAEPAPEGPGAPLARARPGGRRRRVPARIGIIAAGGIGAVAIAVLIAVMSGGRPAPPRAAGTTPPPKPILTDDFSARGNGWVVGDRPADGFYGANGTYRLRATAAGGRGELAEPSNAGHGLGGMTALNLSVSVAARRIAGAAHGYGYGIACRADGNGNYYAFVVQDHAVAVEKWVGGGARFEGPAPVRTTAVRADATNQLRAVCLTTEGGQAVHLTFWVNGKKAVDYLDKDHPYTNGYLGMYVETTTETKTTAEAEFDNFVIAQL
jgi:hypothetical protein